HANGRSLPCLAAAQDHLEHAVCELWIVVWIGAVAIATLQAFVENELETCPNRHRYYRDALFRAIADAMWQTTATLRRLGLMSASGLLSDISVKVLISTEDARTKSMSTFEVDENGKQTAHHLIEIGLASQGCDCSRHRSRPTCEEIGGVKGKLH